MIYNGFNLTLLHNSLRLLLSHISIFKVEVKKPRSPEAEAPRSSVGGGSTNKEKRKGKEEEEEERKRGKEERGKIA